MSSFRGDEVLGMKLPALQFFHEPADKVMAAWSRCTHIRAREDAQCGTEPGTLRKHLRGASRASRRRSWSRPCSRSPSPPSRSRTPPRSDLTRGRRNEVGRRDRYDPFAIRVSDVRKYISGHGTVVSGSVFPETRIAGRPTFPQSAMRAACFAFEARLPDARHFRFSPGASGEVAHCGSRSFHFACFSNRRFIFLSEFLQTPGVSSGM